MHFLFNFHARLENAARGVGETGGTGGRGFFGKTPPEVDADALCRLLVPPCRRCYRDRWTLFRIELGQLRTSSAEYIAAISTSASSLRVFSFPLPTFVWIRQSILINRSPNFIKDIHAGYTSRLLTIAMRTTHRSITTTDLKGIQRTEYDMGAGATKGMTFKPWR